MLKSSDIENPVKVTVDDKVMAITLNRPKAINSLTLEMIELIQNAVDQGATDDNIKLVLLMGAGEKGFCAGADVKAVVKAIDENRKTDAMRFFIQEYALDLCLHRYPKPIIAIAHGITMGGGLGLTAGADVVIATETTRMAMPETRIGFFPDVGATGWLHNKCPQGYPEYLGLTGHELEGFETVRLGLADEMVLNKDVEKAVQTIKTLSGNLNPEKNLASRQIKEGLNLLFRKKPAKQFTEKDQWVKDTFLEKSTIMDILAALSEEPTNREASDTVLRQLADRSPTATVLTLRLLCQNKNRTLEEVFSAETKATEFIISHHDYREGVRARLIDKDNAPNWHPDSFEKAGRLDVDFTP